MCLAGLQRGTVAAPGEWGPGSVLFTGGCRGAVDICKLCGPSTAGINISVL